MGSIVDPVLKLCEAEVYRVHDAGRGRRHRRTRRAAGLRRRTHRRRDPVAATDRQESVDQMRLERRAAMATLLADRGDDLLVVPGLGSTTWDAAAAGDNDRNFYLWGAMGGAAMIGLGLALAQPTAARRGDHRRRRDADGARLARDHRHPAAAQSRCHRLRQRRLWRDRHAAEPHPKRRRSHRCRRRLRHRDVPRRAR